MKLSVLLGVSLLTLGAEQKLAIARNTVSCSSLPVSLKRVKRMLQFLQETTAKVVFYGMEAYPPQLYDLDNPPFRLFYTKRLPKRQEQLITVCGTRYPDGLGAQSAYAFAVEASVNSTSLVASNSRGIDRAALYAVDDAHGTAYVVCDCGLASDRIREQGLLERCNLISAYEPDDQALKFRCLGRNVLSTAMGMATVVMQAPNQSGALNCATCALDLGREVFVHEGGLTGGRPSEGSRYLVSMGAPTIADYGKLATFLGWGHSKSLCISTNPGALYRYGSACYSVEYA